SKDNRSKSRPAELPLVLNNIRDRRKHSISDEEVATFMIFKKAIPRRTFLRGAGTALALPLLDSMIPAFASPLEKATASPLRFGVVYTPNGIIMNEWTPAAVGTAFDLPQVLQPLASVRERFLVLSGLSHNAAYSLPTDMDKDSAPHERAGSTFMTGIH